MLLLLGSLVACNDDEPATTKLPDGVTVRLDQSRIQRQGRVVFLRVHNDTKQPITVARAVLASSRFSTVTWSGQEEIGATYETDLEITLPKGRCGTDVDARVTLTYQVGGGDPRRSTTQAEDPYGNAADFADRDCAELTLQKAAKVTVGDPTVEGTGRTSVLHLAVTMTPTGERDDVRFAGFGSTVLFRQAPGSPADVDVPLGPQDPPAKLDMQVVPARCDAHALAEDKVGRLFPVKVVADDVSENASYFLPLTKTQRLAFFDYFRSTCGLV
ncbi:MAG: hypothetical protein JWR27_567 [Aeromicrobium sp.]|nr:hypothetical protein [Aeromicrobium sp.]